MNTRTEAGTQRDPATAAGSNGAAPPAPTRFPVAWCAVGGERGGEIVPRWFPALPDLGVEHVHLFWSVPESHAAEALEALRSASGRWLVELRALGMEGELSIKRGEPAAWLTALAELSERPLVVLGPPARRGIVSETLSRLLEEGETDLLLLPDLIQPPDMPLLARPVVDADEASTGEPPLWYTPATEWLDLSAFQPERAVRTALRVAEDVDASLLVLPRRAARLAPLALEYGNFPILVPARTRA